MPEPVQVLRKYKPRKNQKPTQKQLDAFNFINRGLSPTQSMLKAGYSETTARNPKQMLLKSQALLNLVDKFKMDLEDEGLSTAYLAKKYKQALEAKKTDEEDWHTQLKALNSLAQIYGVDGKVPLKKHEQQPTRRMTLEEFVSE